MLEDRTGTAEANGEQSSPARGTGLV